jgi:hypothetical protein
MRWSDGAAGAAMTAVLGMGWGCGARTGFPDDFGNGAETSGEPGSSAGPGDGGSQGQGGGGGEGTGVYCTLHHGPVASCESAPGDAVSFCTQVCLEIDGQWGCCTSRGPNNGAGGSCAFPEFLSCSPDGGLPSALR